MSVLGHEGVGTRTPAFDRTVAFFRETLDLRPGVEWPSFVRHDLPDEVLLEVSWPGGPDDPTA